MNTTTACACLGPRNGDPYCPCSMDSRGLTQNPESDRTWKENDIMSLLARLKDSNTTVGLNYEQDSASGLHIITTSDGKSRSNFNDNQTSRSLKAGVKQCINNLSPKVIKQLLYPQPK